MGLSDKHAKWLEEKRGISCETAARAGVGSSGRNMTFDYGTFVKYRGAEKKFWIDPAGVELRFWNETSAAEMPDPDAPLIITEGEMDALSALEAGHANVVSVPNGASKDRPGTGEIDPLDDTAFGYLWEGETVKPWLKKYAKIIVATDNDRKGLVLRDELAIRIGRSTCYYPTYPDDCKDLNDVLVKHGPAAIAPVLRDAKPLVSNKLTTYGSIPSPAIVKSYSTGWAALDPHMMICPPELIIVTGPPGDGKTQWVTALGANLARVHGLRGAILQFEDRPSRNHRDLLRYARAWMHAADGGVTIGTDDPHQWVEDMFLTISPTEDDDEDIRLDLAWVKGAIEEAAKRHSCKWVTIDPFNEIEHLWGVRENETQYLNGALRELKRLARRLQIALIIVTHPTKIGGEKSNIDDLTLYDVAGSAAWKNKADHGIIIHRNSPTDPITTVKIDKARDNEMMGIPGKAQFEFDPQRALFTHVRR
jgi:twinkle protein